MISGSTSHKSGIYAPSETLAKVRKMIAQTQMKGAKMYQSLLTAKDAKLEELETIKGEDLTKPSILTEK